MTEIKEKKVDQKKSNLDIEHPSEHVLNKVIDKSDVKF